MRVLFLTGSPANYMAPPRLGVEQVNCGPDWRNESVAGRVVSLSTPVGSYDLAAIINRLPPEQKPDVVVCLVDASRRNCPANLRAIRCPKVLLLADTHHCEAPLTNLIRYALSEPYDRTVVLYDRHHAEILQAAGLKSLSWLPGLTFPHEDAAVEAARRKHREHVVAFVGQRGRHHPRRSRLLDALQESGVPLDVQAVSQDKALSVYGGSLIGFNASLNGDLNLRIFELLATGGMVLTDQLASASGFFDLWQEGRELVTYRSPAELVERARHYLEHPEEARVIAAAGQRWFDTHFSLARRQQAFASLVSDGVCPPPFTMSVVPRSVAVSSEPPQAGIGLSAYELLQELHREQEKVVVALDPSLAPDFAKACGTLPRVQVITPTETTAGDVDLLVIAIDAARPEVLQNAKRVFICDVPSAAVPALERKFAEYGLASLHPSVPLFGRDVGVIAVATPVGKAAQALESGDYARALQAAQSVLKQDLACLDALLILIDLALEAGNRELANRLLANARRNAPRDRRVLGFLQEVNSPSRPKKLPSRLLATARYAFAVKDWAHAAAAANAALSADPQNAGAGELLGRALLAAGNAAGAVAALESALQRAPGSEALRALLVEAKEKESAVGTRTSSDAAHADAGAGGAREKPPGNGASDGKPTAPAQNTRSLALSPATYKPAAKAVGRKICITFGGEVYDGPTALTVLLAPKFGADEVWVYDDAWIMNERKDFFEQNRWLWEHHHKRGFGWYAWKPFILLDAFERMQEGDVVMYIDADTFPVNDFTVLYDTCARDGGIMLFKAGGNVNQRFKQSQWCKRDCFVVMNQDSPVYYDAEAGVARFALFQKGQWRAQQFLMEWLTYCVNPIATTFDPSVLGQSEIPGFVEHRTEQAIMTNLAHKYGCRLYREACELGNTFPEDKELYPQLFSQLNPWANKTAPCVGSKFRNVP